MLAVVLFGTVGYEFESSGNDAEVSGHTDQ